MNQKPDNWRNNRTKKSAFWFLTVYQHRSVILLKFSWLGWLIQLIEELISELVWLNGRIPRVPKVSLAVLWGTTRSSRRRPCQSRVPTLWRKTAVPQFASSVHIRHSKTWRKKYEKIFTKIGQLWRTKKWNYRPTSQLTGNYNTYRQYYHSPVIGSNCTGRK